MPNCASSRAAGNRQRRDAALGGGIGGLPDLALEGGDRSGRHDDAALAGRRAARAPACRRRASRIMLKVPMRLIAITFSNSASGIGPSRPTMRLAGPTPAQLTRMRAVPCLPRAPAFSAATASSDAGDVAADGEAADFAGVLACAVEVDVEQRDLGAGAGQRRRGLGAEAGGGSGDDRRRVLWGPSNASFRSSMVMTRPMAWRAIELLDQRGAAAEHRALVDRALVGRLAGVERGRLGHQDQPADRGSSRRWPAAPAPRAGGGIRARSLASREHRRQPPRRRPGPRACGRLRYRETPAPRCRRGRRRRSPRRARAARNGRRTARAARRR